MSYLDVNGKVIHYKYQKQSLTNADKGNTKTFVFINSLGTDFRIWEPVANTLNDYGNILLYDKRGHGLSDKMKPKDGLYDYANDLMTIMEHLSIEKCIPVGVSVGGMIAQILADRVPAKIEKLILCDTRHQIGTVTSWNERINTVKAKGLSAISGDIMEKWFSPDFRKHEIGIVGGIKNMVERTPADGYINCCEAIRDANLEKTAKNIKVPTLCVAGTEDKSILPSAIKELVSLIPGSRYQEIDGAGHLPCIDHPAELSRMVLRFIS